MLPEPGDESTSPPTPAEDTRTWDDLTEMEKRLIIAVREDRLPGWIKRKFERWQKEQEELANKKPGD